MLTSLSDLFLYDDNRGSYFKASLDISLKKVKVKYRRFALMSMLNEEKIEVAEQRIIELKTLINHWKTSNISSRRSTADFVEAILADSQETKAA